jgi:hypothetical protein
VENKVSDAGSGFSDSGASLDLEQWCALGDRTPLFGWGSCRSRDAKGRGVCDGRVGGDGCGARECCRYHDDNSPLDDSRTDDRPVYDLAGIDDDPTAWAAEFGRPFR